MFALGKARSLHENKASSLYLLANIRLGMKGLTGDKHSSLFGPFVSCKKGLIKLVQVSPRRSVLTTKKNVRQNKLP